MRSRRTETQQQRKLESGGREQQIGTCTQETEGEDTRRSWPRSRRNVAAPEKLRLERGEEEGCREEEEEERGEEEEEERREEEEKRRDEEQEECRNAQWEERGDTKKEDRDATTEETGVGRPVTTNWNPHPGD
ncbi:hypothetical protein NDU88_010911 [Pleurodeles waltl]|uniref:Uncharacterized protein n=1 Tax=Pleurodeles waltl TaxID=8319 RepID=A0AAV7S0N8_PLEWA|nr:hypothetical protein NDU88_010911 [Pleurodeles waltl]